MRRAMRASIGLLALLDSTCAQSVGVMPDARDGLHWAQPMGAALPNGRTCELREKRIACARDAGLSQHSCESKGCCWGAIEPNPKNEPWCFEPEITCEVHDSLKQDCGFRNQQECEAASCCWHVIELNVNSVPFCYNKGGQLGPHHNVAEATEAEEVVAPVLPNGRTCELDEIARHDCGDGDYADSQESCEQKGCCWGPLVPNPDNEPWCYEPELTCDLNDLLKHDCEQEDQRTCEAVGCCWEPVKEPNLGNLPWCFYKGGETSSRQQDSRIEPMEPGPSLTPGGHWPTGPKTGRSCDVPAKREDCSFGGIDQEGCEDKGCCWGPLQNNPHNEPWCYKPELSCDVHNSLKNDCGHESQSYCEAAGCCWEQIDPNPHSVPSCFYLGGGPDPSLGTTARPAQEAPSSPVLPWLGKAKTTTAKPKPTTTVTTTAKPVAPMRVLPGCEVYDRNTCSGETIETHPKFEASRWFTPLRGDEFYEASFQDYGKLVAHAHVTYDRYGRTAVVEIVAKHKDPKMALGYVFDGFFQASKIRKYDRKQTSPVTLAVKGADRARIELEPVDFIWNAPEIKKRPGDYRGGQKGAIVEMFGWPHKDIEKECEHLATMGYMGVKVFPAQEQVMSHDPFNDVMNPWYFMYQPVSYRLQGRMGTRDDLRQMINTCRSHGVRVYADAVVNHMSGAGNDANPRHRNPQAGCTKWTNKTSSLPGGHSPYYNQCFTYTTSKNTGQPPSQEFPAVPWGPTDFHCERVINSWEEPLELNAGWLAGLTDLATEKDSVQERIADHLTDLIGIGFTGFRIDAAKHIAPEDLVGILTKFKRNMGGSLPVDFITWLEILLGGEADMLMCDSLSGYNYGTGFTRKLRAAGFTAKEILQIKTFNSAYPNNPEYGIDDCNVRRSGTQRQVIQMDDHDMQNPGSSCRDFEDMGCVLVKGCSEEFHRWSQVQMFTNASGAKSNIHDFPIRLILSSFYFTKNPYHADAHLHGEFEAEYVYGIPDGRSDCKECTMNCYRCRSMEWAPAFDAASIGYDKGDGQYTRVHRDEGIVNAMRSWVGLKPISAESYTVGRPPPPPKQEAPPKQEVPLFV